MVTIYPNQLESAKNICQHFKDNNSQVLLVSQTQAGKTGTAIETISQSIKQCKFNRDNIFFICGINDNALKDQAVNDFKLSRVINVENVLFSKDIEEIVWNLNKKLKVKITEQKIDLVVIDECHYANRISSLIDKFITMANPCHILSISATPMAETIWFKNNKEKGLAIEYLKPGSNYTGIVELFNEGKIRQSFQISKDEDIDAEASDSDEDLPGYMGFIDFISDQYETQVNDPLYNIVRLPELMFHTDLEREILDLDMDIKFINLHSQIQIGDKRAPFKLKSKSKLTTLLKSKSKLGDKRVPQSKSFNGGGYEGHVVPQSKS